MGNISNKHPMVVDNIVAKTTTYTATTADDVVTGDTSGGAFSITLPPAADVKGKQMTFVYTDSGFANALTIDGNAAETINGSATTTLDTQYETLRIVSDGTNWVIIDRKTSTPWTAWTPSATWSTNTTVTALWQRQGPNLKGIVHFALAGAPDAAALTFDLPTSLVVDTGVLSGTITEYSIGRVTVLDSGTGRSTGICRLADSNTVQVGTVDVTAGANTSQNNVSNTVPQTMASGDIVSVYIEVPISGWNG